MAGLPFPVNEVQAFEIAGIGGRTSNAREGSGAGIIGPLWERVRAGGALAPLGAREADAVYALYSNYESDASGEYDFTIGVRVGAQHAVPAGYVRRAVERARYARVVSEPGPAGKVVSEAWKRVWSAAPSDMGGARAFRTDFEVHPASSLAGGHDPVAVMVGLK